MRYFILLLSTLLAFPAFAIDENTPPPPQVEISPEQPDIPASAKSGKTLAPDRDVNVTREANDSSDEEPEIQIIRKGKSTVQEYRRIGRLYMIKVIPDIGPPYYFIDTDGNGSLETRRGDRNLDSNVNMWKIIEWE
ncbi:MAG: DUF2782 domain-containing protein [Methylococcales bacterium]|jgi:hypothetical protein|nr:DUF2782 domain-containing protein [Methylococcales bacterium]